MAILKKHISLFIILCSTQYVTPQATLNSDSVQRYIQRAEELQDQYKYEESLELAKTALQNALYNDDSQSKAHIYQIIGKNYEINGDDQKAIRNYVKALTFSQISKNKILEIDIYNSLANLYVRHEFTIKKGIEYYDKSYKLAIRLEDTVRMIRPLLNLGSFYISKGNYSEAYFNLSPARKLVNESTSNLDKTKLNSLLGRYFLHLERYDRAEEHIEEAISYALLEINKETISNQTQSTFYEELAILYKSKSALHYAQEDFKRAINYNEEYYRSKLRAIDIKNLIELQRANIKYEVDQYQAKIKQAEFDKAEREIQIVKWQMSIFLGVVLILISLAFLISSNRNNFQKKKLNRDLIEKNKELKSAKETAEQVSTLKSQFISTVSHELRTPLYGVIGLTSLLMENPDEKKKNEYLESLKFSGDYLLALINDVLQLSKIETNEVTLEEVTFDLRSLIEGITNSLRTKQKSNRNTVHINIDPKITTTLIGDSVRLSQVLINLIGNALKFTVDGNIWVSVVCMEQDDKHYVLRFIVKDDGIGIPDNKQKSIFENFAQVKNQNQEYEGTGLGLAIVRKLIQLHQSEIYVESVEGLGSKFHFDLRYKKAIKSEQISASTRANLSVGTTNFNILIVDDNRINQIVTQNILKKKGYTCDVASNGIDAISMLKKGEYDLVLMDINMPELDGLEATKVIRTFNSTIPIIALTAVEEREVRQQALSVGMNDVIVKPYDTQQFFQTIMKNISKVKSI
ncbi:response regulator [Aquimarina sp. W85]|uniref:tetratricopeptide repeat-containing hybrid sensor histidine kinase/response regulator n=1 Tax=Aquimarina rhodophyticola TaxID=3342246 RepID=UPI00366AF671